MSRPSKLFPSLSLVCGLLAGLVLLVLPRARLKAFWDGDSLMHVRVGEEILRLGHPPHTDFLSFTQYGKPYVAHEWLYQLASGALTRGFGLEGVLWFAAVLGALVIYLVVGRTLRRKAGVPAALAAGLLVALMTGHWYLARPHLVSCVGFALGMIALDDERWRSRRDARIPLVAFAATAFWANFHTGVFIFLAVFALDTAVRRASWSERRWTLLVLASAALGTLATPYGIHTPLLVLGFLFETTFRRITEHYAFQPKFAVSEITFIVSALFLIAYAARRYLSLRRQELATTAFLAVLTILSGRNVVFFAIAASGLLAQALDEWVPWHLSAKNLRAFARSDLAWLVAAAALALAVDPAKHRPLEALAAWDDNDPVHPMRAAKFVRESGDKLGPRMFNSYSIGSYLTYALPERRVFIDGRADFYGADHFTDAFLVCKGVPEALKYLEVMKIDWAFLDDSCTPLRRILKNASWREVFSDGWYYVLVKP